MVYDETDRIRRLYHWECNTKGGGWGAKKVIWGQKLDPKQEKNILKKLFVKNRISMKKWAKSDEFCI